MKSDFESFCTISGKEDAKTDLYLLHGYSSSPLSQDILRPLFQDFRIIQCTARGHGSRKGNKLDWMGTIKDYNNLIRKNRRPAIIIGHSMGGTQALTLTTINPYVTQVFAVSAIHGKDFFMHKDIAKQLNLTKQPKSLIRYGQNHLLPALPENYLQCDPANKNKYFLIHANNDTRVPFDQFQANKSELCLPKKNIKIIRDIPGFINLSHNLALLGAIRYIQKKIRT